MGQSAAKDDFQSSCRQMAGRIAGFLDDEEIRFSVRGESELPVIHTETGLRIMPLAITARSTEEAHEFLILAENAIAEAEGKDKGRPIIITEDRWRSEGDCIRRRLLAHMGIFTHVFARNCEVRKLHKGEAADFMNRWHSYGDATCRYRLGLFLKKPARGANGELQPGEMVAAATFSNGRLMERGGKYYRSYQWIRYASLPDVRVTGGMGKIMKHFLDEAIAGDEEDRSTDRFGGWDIMSYADLEWSDGNVYRRLGFADEGHKSPVMYRVEPITWTRKPVFRLSDDEAAHNADCMYYENFGSTRYRLTI